MKLKYYLRSLEQGFVLFECFSGLDLFLSISLLAWLRSENKFSDWKALVRNYKGIKYCKIERVKQTSCYLKLLKYLND